MHSSKFQVHQAQSVAQALELFEQNPGARYLAGGTDLFNQIRCGAGQRSDILINVKGIESLGGIEPEDGGLRIGPTVTAGEVARSELVLKDYPALAECCRQIGSYPLRNLATVAGNICNASPCADSSAALLALDAQVTAQSHKGPRKIALTDFFEGPGLTALAPGELLTAIHLPVSSKGAVFHYGRLGRRKGVDISTVAVLLVHLAQQKPAHRISMLSVGPRPMRVPGAEKVLDEQGAQGAPEAVRIARETCSPIDDVRGSAAYRKEMVGVLLQRGVDVLSGKGDRS